MRDIVIDESIKEFEKWKDDALREADFDTYHVLYKVIKTLKRIYNQYNFMNLEDDLK